MRNLEGEMVATDGFYRDGCYVQAF
jgi:hypothetical protein